MSMLTINVFIFFFFRFKSPGLLAHSHLPHLLRQCPEIVRWHQIQTCMYIYIWKWSKPTVRKEWIIRQNQSCQPMHYCFLYHHNQKSESYRYKLWISTITAACQSLVAVEEMWPRKSWNQILCEPPINFMFCVKLSQQFRNNRLMQSMHG